MTLESLNPRPIRKDAEAGTSTTAATVASASAPASDAAAPASADLDAGLVLRPFLLDDASVVMPSSAPRNVRIGVALVTFAGAEGAPPSARSKRDAQAIADRLG